MRVVLIMVAADVITRAPGFLEYSVSNYFSTARIYFARDVADKWFLQIAHPYFEAIDCVIKK
jgi:hypothetical protein